MQSARFPRGAWRQAPVVASPVTQVRHSRKPAQAEPQRRTGRERVTIGFAYRNCVFAMKLRPWLAALACFAFLLFGSWYATATVYLVYRDMAVSAGAGPEVDVTAHYEDRIAAMAAEIRRLQSRQLVTQSTFESKIETILAKQSEIEQRHEAVSRLLGTRTPSAKMDTGKSSAVGPRAAVEELRGATGAVPASLPDAGHSRSAALPRVAADLARIEREQTEALQALESRARSSIGRLRETLAGLGLTRETVTAKASAFAADGAGGPFVPFEVRATSSFEARLEHVERTVAALDLLREKGRRLPLLRPLNADAEVTSSFGPRIDPFLRRPALHTGLDFRTDFGQPVLATAGGVVTAAEFSGGYGQLVEVDHGDGIATRYAHLSSIAVAVGKTVGPGTVIGFAGSTGRSTATHLHYETHIDGEAVDPMKFIDAGAKVAPLLSQSASAMFAGPSPATR